LTGWDTVKIGVLLHEKWVYLSPYRILAFGKIISAKNLCFKTLVTVNKSAIFAALFTRLAHFGR
jgi:hypothetical protein